MEGKRDRSAIDFFGFGQELLNSFPSVKDIPWKRLEVRSSVHCGRIRNVKGAKEDGKDDGSNDAH